jgi:rod shape-determining protein MreD
LRWFIYFILAYIILGLQLGLGSFIAFRDVSPNLMVLLVVFISLNAPREEALLASFLLGMFQDLITLQPLGLFAFSYGIVSLLVCMIAESVGRSHPLTHVSLAFMATMVVGVLLLIHDLVSPVGPARPYGGTALKAIRIGPRVVAVSAAYTTLISPLVIFLLQRFNRLLSFHQQNRWRNRV